MQSPSKHAAHSSTSVSSPSDSHQVIPQSVLLYGFDDKLPPPKPQQFQRQQPLPLPQPKPTQQSPPQQLSSDELKGKYAKIVELEKALDSLFENMSDLKAPALWPAEPLCNH